MNLILLAPKFTINRIVLPDKEKPPDNYQYLPVFLLPTMAHLENESGKITHTGQVMKKRTAGEILAATTLDDIYGNPVSIPDSHSFIHLQFRRFSGCPVCNIHMGQLMSRKIEIENNNIKEIIVFYSTEKSMKENLGDVPFTLIADPQKQLYQQFGVEQSIKSVINPLSWPAVFKGLFKNIGYVLRMLPKANESMFGLPADFLIAPDGKLVSLKYGIHADDQWSVDELLAQLK